MTASHMSITQWLGFHLGKGPTGTGPSPSSCEILMLDSTIYNYTLNNGTELNVLTDPSGTHKAGVGGTVWDSSLILAKHFERVMPLLPSNSERPDLPRDKFKVLELGCGSSAIPSLVLNLMNLVQTSTITDKASVIPLLDASLAQIVLPCTPISRTIDWTNSQQYESLGDLWDLIVVSDCFAFPELYIPLVATLKATSSQSTLIYIAYERRELEKEIEFFKLFGQSFKFENVLKHELDDLWRADDSIYLYRGWRR